MLIGGRAISARFTEGTCPKALLVVELLLSKPGRETGAYVAHYSEFREILTASLFRGIEVLSTSGHLCIAYTTTPRTSYASFSKNTLEYSR